MDRLTGSCNTSSFMSDNTWPSREFGAKFIKIYIPAAMRVQSEYNPSRYSRYSRYSTLPRASNERINLILCRVRVHRMTKKLRDAKKASFLAGPSSSILNNINQSSHEKFGRESTALLFFKPAST